MRLALLVRIGAALAALPGCGKPALDSGGGLADADGDGHAPYELGGDDCDDADPGRYSGADEHCDGRDEDCDLRVDEEPVDGAALYLDADGDGWGSGPLAGGGACEAGQGEATADGDCDDEDPRVNPGAAEEGFNGVDDDCDPTTADICGDSAPTPTALSLEILDDYDFGGVIAPAVRLSAEFEDPDGDAGTGSLLRLWWGPVEAGGADTAAPPDYELGGGTPSSGCGSTSWRGTLNLQVGGILEPEVRYEIAAQLLDKGGTASALATGAITTPAL